MEDGKSIQWEWPERHNVNRGKNVGEDAIAVFDPATTSTLLHVSTPIT